MTQNAYFVIIIIIMIIIIIIIIIDKHVTWINWHIATGSNFILTLPNLTLTLNKWRCAWGGCVINYYYYYYYHYYYYYYKIGILCHELES